MLTLLFVRSIGACTTTCADANAGFDQTTEIDDKRKFNAQRNLAQMKKQTNTSKANNKLSIFREFDHFQLRLLVVDVDVDDITAAAVAASRVAAAFITTRHSL